MFDCDYYYDGDCDYVVGGGWVFDLEYVGVVGGVVLYWFVVYVVWVGEVFGVVVCV